MNERDSAITNSHRQYIIGTAGHIDHGKTALVRALTGIDTDRLPEEKARGITIELGFAHFADNITIIDVPGHEKLVKTMVAGVSSIDLMLLVVAADDGVMPQTREHIDIIRLLQIRHGIIALTKIDLVDAEWLKLVEDDVRGLLKDTAFSNAPLLHTSAENGTGIDDLARQIHISLHSIPPRLDPQIFRMPVDRVFSVRGFGTVLTGTILGGSVKEGDHMQLQPGGKEVRVRGLQSHDTGVAEMHVGYRAAINLAGLENTEAARGMVLTQADLFEPLERLNARVHLLSTAPAPLKSNQRVRLHLHTGEVPARVVLPLTNRLQPGEDTLLQLRLEEPMHAAFGDRFIIRQYSPQHTIGGGTVLQVNPPRYRKKYLPVFRESLQWLEGNDIGQRILGAFDRIDCTALSLRQLKLATGISETELTGWLKQPEAQRLLFADTAAGNRIYFSYQQLETVLLAIEWLLERYHRDFPSRAGQSEAELVGALERRFLAGIVRRSLRYGVQQQRLADKPAFRLAGFAPQLSARDSEAYHQLEALYREGGLTPPTTREAMEILQLAQKPFRELLMLFREDQQLIPVDEGLFFHYSAIAKLQELVAASFAKSDELTVPRFKELTQTTRKHAIPLLTWLDKQGITRRDGDIRRRNS